MIGVLRSRCLAYRPAPPRRPLAAGVDTSGTIYFAAGLPVPGFSSSAAAAGQAAMHQHALFMWVTAEDGTPYDVAVTTMHHAHTLHGGTTPGVSAPIHGFFLGGRLYLDPSGVLCEPAAGSTLTQTAASAAFVAEYVEFGLLPAAPLSGVASNCIVSGHVVLGVEPTTAVALSSFLLREAATRFEGLPGRERLLVASPGHARFVRGGIAALRKGGLRRSEGRNASSSEVAAAPRDLAKTSFAQSAGTRTMLFMRAVWSDQGAADASMNDATFLAYASSFVEYTNNRTYGNAAIVPTYTPGCVYVLPSHTYAQVGGGSGQAADLVPPMSAPPPSPLLPPALTGDGHCKRSERCELDSCRLSERALRCCVWLCLCVPAGKEAAGRPLEVLGSTLPTRSPTSRYCVCLQTHVHRRRSAELRRELGWHCCSTRLLAHCAGMRSCCGARAPACSLVACAACRAAPGTPFRTTNSATT